MCTIQTFINFKTSLAITLKISLVIYVSAQSGFLFTFFMACLHRPKRIKKCMRAACTGCLFFLPFAQPFGSESETKEYLRAKQITKMI